MADQQVSSARQWALPFDGIAPPGAFRLFLAFLVVLSHISAIDVGRLGVMMFFYLSGYWTANIWAGKFKGRFLGRFYLSRYWRVAPLFLVVTIAAALVRGFELRPENFTLFGIASSDNDPTGVSWSLDVELQFYLLLPLIMLLLPRAPLPTILASFAVAVVGWWLDNTYEITTVLKFLPAFVLGSLTFTAAWRPGRRTAWLSAGAFLAFTVVTTMTPFMLKTTPDPFDQDIWALLWMIPLLPYIAHSLTVRSTRLDRDLGNLSFPLYLVHYATIAVLTGSMGVTMLSKGLGVLVSCVLAVAIYVLIDRPIDAWRVKVTERSIPA